MWWGVNVCAVTDLEHIAGRLEAVRRCRTSIYDMQVASGLSRALSHLITMSFADARNFNIENSYFVDVQTHNVNVQTSVVNVQTPDTSKELVGG